jgi:hypothetical protein
MNANITKLLLSKHGYSDKQEIDHTTNGKDVGKTTDEELTQKLKDLGIDCG